MILGYKFIIDDYIVYICIGVVVIFFLIIELIKKKKDHKTVMANIVSQLINHSFSNVTLEKNDVKCSYGKKKFVVHVEKFGHNKSLLMTNSTTIFKRHQKASHKPVHKSVRLDYLNDFLKLKDEKILFIQNDLVKKEKYINENEMEAISYNVKSFDTYIVNESEFKLFLDYLIEVLSSKKQTS